MSARQDTPLASRDLGLDADTLHPHLKTRWLARSYRWLERTDSTNRVAADWAHQGALNGATVVAESQDAGRGRLGRSFFSPPYRNLYTSIVLRGELRPSLVFAAAIAVAETAAKTISDPGRIEIKWPNDVLIGGLKTAGILVEAAGSGTNRFAVLGIGVNLNVARAELPEEFRGRATSLADSAGHDIDRVGFAAGLYGTLETTLERHERGGFEAIRPDFERFFQMQGRRVQVREVSAASLEGEGTAGQVVGVASDGALRIVRDDGSEEQVLAGDVTVVKGGLA